MVNTMSSLSIEQIPLTRKDLDQLLLKCDFSTLLQSFSHAWATRQTQLLNSSLYIIKKEKEEIGFFVMQEGSVLFNLLHVMTIDRGPLWFKGQETHENIHKFIKVFSQKYKKRWGRKRRFLIESSNQEIKQSLIEQKWDEHQWVPAYQTQILCLKSDYDTLYKNYHAKWRQGLEKAKKQNLNIIYDTKGAYIDQLLSTYHDHKDEKGYQGPSKTYLNHLYTDLASDHKLLIIVIKKDQDIHSMTAFPLHGKTATYQTGWTSKDGRKSSANYLALDCAIQYLQKHAYGFLDLGGINEEHAAGVTLFKKRMGGSTMQLIGQFG